MHQISRLMFIFVVLFSLSTYAQVKKPVSRSECTRLCTLDLPEKLIASNQDLLYIRAALAKEDKADVIRTLKKQEQEEIDKIRERAALMCQEICLANPE